MIGVGETVATHASVDLVSASSLYALSKPDPGCSPVRPLAWVPLATPFAADMVMGYKVWCG